MRILLLVTRTIWYRLTRLVVLCKIPPDQAAQADIAKIAGLKCFKHITIVDRKRNKEVQVWSSHLHQMVIIWSVQQSNACQDLKLSMPRY